MAFRQSRPRSPSTWQRPASPEPSPPASPLSGADEDDDENLLKMVRSVQLSGTSTTPQADHGWHPSTARILSDLSTPDFDRQARANSLAASQAMSHAPPSVIHGNPPDLDPPVVRPSQERMPHLTRPATQTSAGKHKPDFVEQWYESPVNTTLNDPTPAAWRYRDPIPSGWRQPRFQPGHRHEEVAARDRLAPPVMGGRSKKDQLGSVNASWGPIGEAGQKVYGMFEIEQDPPSRSTSPFKEPEPEPDVRPKRSEVRAAKNEALERAREGTQYARSSSSWSDGGRRVAAAEMQDRTTPITESLSTRTSNGRPEWGTRPYLDSILGARNISSSPAITERQPPTPFSVAQTPASAASRDVFGPRRRVPGQDGW